MTTIELNDRTISAIQAIWDHDHGTSNEGWHLRITYTDSGDEDDSGSPISDLPASATDAEIISALTLWLWNPDGMSDQEAQDLRDMIEVRR